MIHVAYGLYDKDGHYSKFTGTSMLSIFENTSAEITVHILHDNTLMQENRDKFNYIAGRYNQQVKFYNVEKICADKITELKNLMPGVKTTIGTFYRFLVTDLLPSDIKKLIYLDSDIIVNLNVSELWQIELGDNVFAAVSEFANGVPQNMHTICREKIVDGSKYFNAGVLLINLLQFKNEQAALKDAINFIANNPKYECFDQDILNYCFLKKSISLPKKFNVLVEYARRLGDFNVEQKICHYINSSRGIGFGLDAADPYNHLFIKYFSKTPYFNEETIGKLYSGIKKIYIQQKKLAIKISKIMSGKKRAFFIQPNAVDSVKKIFYVQPDEEIILADSPASLQNLINSMNLSKDKKVFFIFVNNFPAIYNALIKAGFKPGEDFVNITELLSDADGVPLNSYLLIKLL